MNKVISRMKLQCTISVSTLVEEVSNLEPLKVSLEIVIKYAKKRHPNSTLEYVT